MFTVIISSRARKDSKKLPEDMKRKVVEIFDYIEKNPIPVERYDVKKIRGMHGIYRIKSGKWRLIYSVDFVEKKIVIIRVSQREGAYKDL